MTRAEYLGCYLPKPLAQQLNDACQTLALATGTWPSKSEAVRLALQEGLHAIRQAAQADASPAFREAAEAALANLGMDGEVNLESAFTAWERNGEIRRLFKRHGAPFATFYFIARRCAIATGRG